MEIVPGVHQVDGVLGANVFLIVDHGLTLIDTGTKFSGKRIVQYIKDLGRPITDLERIILTHHHFDHTGSLLFLRKASGASAYSHAADLPIIEGRTPPHPFKLSPLMKFLFAPMNLLMKAPYAEIDAPLADGEVIDILGGLAIIHTPGHTAGSISLLLREKGVVFVGDALNNQKNRITGPSPVYSKDLSEARESVRKIASFDFDVCCVSHGQVIRSSASRQVRDFAAMLT